MMITAAAGISFAAADARADVAPPSGGSSGGADNSSTGTAQLKFEYTKGLDTSISTPDLGFTKTILGQTVTATVKAAIHIDPVKNGGPLYSVDMPKGAIVEASWGGDKKIVLKAANGAQTDGTMSVRHTLSPDLTATLGVGSIKTTINYDATKLLQLLQAKAGTNARFNYDSKGSQQFAPWGFNKVDTKLSAPDLNGAELFTLGLDKFPELISNNFEGEIGVRAVTAPTFSYKTTKVMLGGAPDAISANGGEVVVAAEDGDFLETMATVEGEVSVAGNMTIQPFLQITKAPIIGNITIDVPINAYSKAYTTPAQKVQFQAVTVHIPLPNVHAPKDGVDLGAVKANGSATKTVTIENSGEKAATVSFKSSDPHFTVPTGSMTIEPKGKYELAVKFSADNAGPALTEISVMSNDPDSPVQTFKVGANGADVGGKAGEADGPGNKPEGDSGCGCKTAGGTSSLPSWAGYGLVGLGAIVFVRRRRNAAK
jgi:MYXO-CTERM domain-containing protein